MKPVQTIRPIVSVAFWTITLTGILFAQGMDPVGVLKKVEANYYFQGGSFKAKVKMRMESPDGKTRTRELSMLRVNLPKDGEQRFFMYFHSPEDVRRMAFLVNKYPSREDDRWLFVPSIELVQRIASRDAGSSFAGSDFSYEDVSGRDLTADTHKYLREEVLGKIGCIVIESTPNSPAAYQKKVSWIDKEKFLPVKEEYSDVQGRLIRVFTADEVTDVAGIPTVTKRTMKDLRSNHQTIVEFSGCEYNLNLNPNDFNERALRNPNPKWIQ